MDYKDLAGESVSIRWPKKKGSKYQVIIELPPTTVFNPGTELLWGTLRAETLFGDKKSFYAQIAEKKLTYLQSLMLELLIDFSSELTRIESQANPNDIDQFLLNVESLLTNTRSKIDKASEDWILQSRG